tara:strand:- start:205 stop:480 length:276 start_codon:yes stop_codon:yes gene_type:complete
MRYLLVSKGITNLNLGCARKNILMISFYFPESSPAQYEFPEVRSLFLMVGENAPRFDGRLVMKNSSVSLFWDDFLQVTNQVTNIVVHLVEF